MGLSETYFLRVGPQGRLFTWLWCSHTHTQRLRHAAQHPRNQLPGPTCSSASSTVFS